MEKCGCSSSELMTVSGLPVREPAVMGVATGRKAAADFNDPQFWAGVGQQCSKALRRCPCEAVGSGHDGHQVAPL
jgi:hypothetical protein